MDKKYTYHKDEIIHTTVESIINFFINNDRSNRMTFSSKAMKIIYQYYNNPDKCPNLFIGSKSLSGTSAEITGGVYNGSFNETEINNYIVNTIPVLFVIVDGKKVVLYDIIEYPGNSGHSEDFHVSLVHSEYSRKVLGNLRDSEKSVEKFKL